MLLGLSAIVACNDAGSLPVRTVVARNGEVSMPVRVVGNLASGNALIAVHGGPGMTSDYLFNLEALAGSELAVVTYDQRGVGRSSSPPAEVASYTLEKYADDIDAVLDAIDVEEVDLFGHSWGGIVVLRYASLHPDRVRSVVLMGSGPPTYAQTRQSQDAIARRVADLTAQGLIVANPEPSSPAAERGVLPAYFSDPNFWFSDDDPGGAPRIDARTNEVGELTWAAIAGFDLTPDLADLDHRVLNLWGADDAARSIASPAIAAALPKADVTTVVLDACGHFWHECPDQFFAAVQPFLDDDPNGTSPTTQRTAVRAATRSTVPPRFGT